ncbi:MAG TPA: Uma2 family endonuclease [Candidatus Obscuribacterales bacterium]
MSRQEFHRAYEQAPPEYRAELIAGVVHEPSPVSYSHGTFDSLLGTIIGLYVGNTPGVSQAHNASVFLSDEDEVQPDIMLLIEPSCKGQSKRTEDDYVEGAPELVAEIALSSQAIDLGLKKKRYAMFGVLEYIVVCVRPRRIQWFDLPSGRTLAADSNGILQSVVFPGLWINRRALLELDYQGCMRTVEQGLQTKAHEEFVLKLASA